MRKTFRRWLTAFMVLAFFVTVIISFVAQSNMAASSADDLLNSRIVDARGLLDDYGSRSARARTIVDSEMIVAARAFANSVADNPSMISNQGWLQQMADDLNVDELDVTDGNGVIVASIPAENVGYDMHASTQSSAFIGAIEYPQFELVQAFQAQGKNSTEMVKYGGVARTDTPGIVQVGVYSSHIEKTMGLVDLSEVAAGLNVGDSGQVLIAKGDTIVSCKSSDLIGSSLSNLGFDRNKLLEQTGSTIADVNGVQERVRVSSYKSYTIVAMVPTSEVYLSRNNSLIGMTGFIFLVFCFVFYLVSKLVQKLVIDGIFSVNGSLSRITAGNLDERVDVDTTPEFKSLSSGINTTVDALKDHIAAEASRIDADLALAKAIQLGNLQTVFPAFPDQDEFDLYAHMTPAREVGGDFYDMFMPDSNHLICVIADVSGKGIPAAMFMMEAKSFINSFALQCDSLPEAFRRANNKLCENNDAGLFVTAFIISFDLRNGCYEFVNAGHNRPVIRHANGSCEFMSCKPEFVLGGMEDMDYHANTGRIGIGDSFIGYTDGVTEALNEELKLYGDDRLLDFLDKSDCSLNARQLVEALQDNLTAYRGSAEQADDITVLVMEYNGYEGAGSDWDGTERRQPTDRRSGRDRRADARAAAQGKKDEG